MKRRLLTLVLAFTASTGLWAADLGYSEGGGQCYKERDIMYPRREVFEALKQTLMQANLNIATVTEVDGVITARGNQYNEDTITEITLSISFRPIDENSTHVQAIASYNTHEKKREIGQVGANGITLPIPVPLTGRYAMTGSGNIEDTDWYRGFYDSLNKILFIEKMRYIE